MYASLKWGLNGVYDSSHFHIIPTWMYDFMLIYYLQAREYVEMRNQAYWSFPADHPKAPYYLANQTLCKEKFSSIVLWLWILSLFFFFPMLNSEKVCLLRFLIRHKWKERSGTNKARLQASIYCWKEGWEKEHNYDQALFASRHSRITCQYI